MDPVPVVELIPPTRVLRQLSVQAVMNVLLREGGASRAGLARQTVYNYYPNGNELLATAFRREGTRFAEAIAAHIRGIAGAEQ